MAVYLPYFIVTTHTHTCISEILHKGGWRHSMDQCHCYPFQLLLPRHFLFHNPPSLCLVLSACCVPLFSASLEVLPTSIYLSSYHLTSKTSLSFHMSIYFFALQTWILRVVHGWTQTVPTNTMTKPYHQTHSGLSCSGVRNKVKNCCESKQGMRESPRIQGSCHNPVVPAFI